MTADRSYMTEAEHVAAFQRRVIRAAEPCETCQGNPCQCRDFDPYADDDFEVAGS